MLHYTILNTSKYICTSLHMYMIVRIYNSCQTIAPFPPKEYFLLTSIKKRNTTCQSSINHPVQPQTMLIPSSFVTLAAQWISLEVIRTSHKLVDRVINGQYRYSKRNLPDQVSGDDVGNVATCNVSSDFFSVFMPLLLTRWATHPTLASRYSRYSHVYLNSLF